MRVFYNGKQKNLSYSACPAGHLPAAECPQEWFDDEGQPRTFPIRFVNGEAIVPDTLGRYLVKERVCRTHNLVFPGAHAA